MDFNTARIHAQNKNSGKRNTYFTCVLTFFVDPYNISDRIGIIIKLNLTICNFLLIESRAMQSIKSRPNCMTLNISENNRDENKSYFYK